MTTTHTLICRTLGKSSSLVVCLWLCCGSTWAQPATNLPDQEVAVDTLGDPLPKAALLRLGTLRFQHPSSVRDIALAPNDEVIITIGGRFLIAWDTTTGQELWRTDPNNFGVVRSGAAYGVRSVVFDPDGESFYVPGAGKINRWNTRTGTLESISITRSFEFGRMLAGPARAASIDVAPDGEAFAVGSSKDLIVVDRKGKQQFVVRNEPKASIDEMKIDRDRLVFGGHYSYAVFSPDGNSLAAVMSQAPKTLRLLDAKSGQDIRSIPLTSWLVRMAFLPSGTHIVTTERDSSIRCYDIETGEQAWAKVLEPAANAESYTSAVTCSADGRWVAAGAPMGSDQWIYLLDAQTGVQKSILKGHAWKPWCVSFTSNSQTLYSAGWDGPIRKWDVDTGEQLPPPEGVRGSSVVAASPDGSRIAYADDLGTIRVVDPTDGNEIGQYRSENVRFGKLEFSGDGRYLAAGGSSGSEDLTVFVVDVLENHVAQRWDWPRGRDPHSSIECFSFTPDGTRLATAVFRQSQAYLWDLESGKQIAELPHRSIYGLSFSADSKTLATAGWDKAVRRWDAATGEERETTYMSDVLPNEGDLRMYTVSYSPAGDIAATAHLDGMVRIWDAESFELKHQFKIEGRFIYGSIRFSPDGLWLATGSMRGDVQLWDPYTGETMWNVGQHQSYAYTVDFGKDSRSLVSGGADDVGYLWNLVPEALETRSDMPSLWQDLGSEEPATAYAAFWHLAQGNEQAVDFLSTKLQAIEVVLDLQKNLADLEEKQASRRRQLTKRLAEKDDSAELLRRVRRGISILGQIGSERALAAIEQLLSTSPSEEIQKLARDALRT